MRTAGFLNCTCMPDGTTWHSHLYRALERSCSTSTERPGMVHCVRWRREPKWRARLCNPRLLASTTVTLPVAVAVCASSCQRGASTRCRSTRLALKSIKYFSCYQSECHCYKHTSVQSELTTCSQIMEYGQVVRHRSLQIDFAQHVVIEVPNSQAAPDQCVIMLHQEHMFFMFGSLHSILDYPQAITLSGYLASTVLASECAAGARALCGGGAQGADPQAHPHRGLPLAQGAGAGPVHAAQGYRHQAHS